MRHLIWIIALMMFMTACGSESYKTEKMKTEKIVTNSFTKIKSLENAALVLESEIEKIPFFKAQNIIKLKENEYLIAVNSGGVHGPQDFNYIICSPNYQTCIVSSPDDRAVTKCLRLESFQQKYYFTFGYESFEGSQDSKKWYIEADMTTGKTKQIKKIAIPAQANQIDLHYSDLCKSDKKSDRMTITEDEIANKTGIKKHPSQQGEGWSSDSMVYAISSGEKIIVARKNSSGDSDINSSSYDLIAVFEKDSWRKIWEISTQVDDFMVLGSMMFLQNEGFRDLTTGKPVSDFKKVRDIGCLDGLFFMFAEKDGKPKLFVLNIDKIDELKN